VPEKKPAASARKAATAKPTAPRKAATARRAAPARAAVATKATPKRVVRKRVISAPARPAAASALAAPRTRRRTKLGLVVSAKQKATVIVEVERLRQHPLYKKAVRVRKKFAAHDEAGDVRAGDLVRIQESRPYSATKRWRVLEVLSRAGEAGAAAPRVADVEKMLEEAEGVTDLLTRTRPESESGSPKGGEEEAVPASAGSEKAAVPASAGSEKAAVRPEGGSET
jgi:small subunit ribosomal protein S17